MRRYVQIGAILFAASTGYVLAQPTPGPEATLNAEQFNQRLKEAIQEKKALPTPMTPSEAQHVVLVVETNKKGQVTRVRFNGSKGSSNDTFNAMTYGNALQTFIRTEDGHAVAGTYRLIYDYSPDTQKVRRTVELIKAGGVNPNAVGAVDDMARVNMHRMQLDHQMWEAAMKKARAAKAKAQAQAHAHASPKPTATPKH